MDRSSAVAGAEDLRREDHPCWRALTLGMLSAEEEAVLRRAAPDLYERCRPLDADRMVARVERARGGGARIRPGPRRPALWR
jgi:hypothetical protein